MSGAGKYIKVDWISCCGVRSLFCSLYFLSASCLLTFSLLSISPKFFFSLASCLRPPCSSCPIKVVGNIIRQTSGSPAPSLFPFSHNQACTLTIKGDIANKIPRWSAKTHTYTPAKRIKVGWNKCMLGFRGTGVVAGGCRCVLPRRR